MRAGVPHSIHEGASYLEAAAASSSGVMQTMPSTACTLSWSSDQMDLKTSLCLCMDPMDCTSCKNPICKKCVELTKWKCPNRCTKGQFKKSHKFVRRALEETYIYCPNKGQGC